MRRQFQLPGADEDFLDGLGRPWETIIDRGDRWTLMLEWPIVPGYNYSIATAAVRIEQGYPDAQLDMVYFLPHLSRSDGMPIGALANQTIDGTTWQRWSRHRTGANPWRPGVDDLSTHMFLVDHWLLREFAKRAA